MKRYFITDKTTTKLPWQFVHSRGKRYISLVSCDFVEKETIVDESNPKIKTVMVRVPQQIQLHANIIHEDRYLDSFVDFCNRDRSKRSKYEQLCPEEELKVWFTNVDNTEITEAVLKNCEFVVKLLLEWEEK